METETILNACVVKEKRMWSEIMGGESFISQNFDVKKMTEGSGTWIFLPLSPILLAIFSPAFCNIEWCDGGMISQQQGRRGA